MYADYRPMVSSSANNSNIRLNLDCVFVGEQHWCILYEWMRMETKDVCSLFAHWNM